MNKYNVLWIDDDFNGPALDLEKSCLVNLGCTLTGITNPDQIDYNILDAYDCVIVDLVIPYGTKFNGVETDYGSRTGLAILKRIAIENPRVKNIIMYTCFEIPEVKEYCESRSIPYITKNQYVSSEFANFVVSKIEGEEFISKKDQFKKDMNLLLSKLTGDRELIDRVIKYLE